MRMGKNPLKVRTKVKKSRAVTVAVLNFVPVESGYFRESLAVLKLCLASIRKNTKSPHDLLVFDNGSARPVVEFLLDEKQHGRIDYLILSESNVGKVGAWNIMLKAAPGKYVAYADGDVFFYPGWLEEHLKIFEAFPWAGMVTGLPMRHTNLYRDGTLAIARQHPEIEIEQGKLISPETLHFFCDGVGLDYNYFMKKFGQLDDFRLTHRGRQAYVGSSHFQFVLRKEVADRILPLPVTAPLNRTNTKMFDEAVEAAGVMRLSVLTPFVQHLGNVLTPEWGRVAREYGIAARSSDRPDRAGSAQWKLRLREIPVVKRMLLKVYNEIFNLYIDRV